MLIRGVSVVALLLPIAKGEFVVSISSMSKGKVVSDFVVILMAFIKSLVPISILLFTRDICDVALRSLNAVVVSSIPHKPHEYLHAVLINFVDLQCSEMYLQLSKVSTHSDTAVVLIVVGSLIAI